MKIINKLLLVLLFHIVLNPCNANDEQEVFDKIEVIIVNKIPRGVFAGEEMPEPFQDFGWYDIGLSINGQEPIEYIWRAVGGRPYSYTIMAAKIGDKGTIYQGPWGRLYNIKLPRPNAEKPPVIGLHGEVLWEKITKITLNDTLNKIFKYRKYY